MKLLFDQNLSHKLVGLLQDLFPESQHVRNLGLRESSDEHVWGFAESENLVIVSKDKDFYARSMILGFPPKVIWIQTGNCLTDRVDTLLRRNFDEIAKFVAHDEVGILALL